MIVALSAGFTQTTIIIDALDECDRGTRNGLFLTLKQIIDSTTHVRIFLTGRSDGDIQRMLRDFPSHYLDATDNSGDISTYIHSEITRCSNEGLLLDEDEIDQVLESEIIRALEQGADGMYGISPHPVHEPSLISLQVHVGSFADFSNLSGAHFRGY